MLQSMCGDMPWKMLVRQYNSAAVQHKWPTRTETALLRRCEDMKVSRWPVGEWITTGTIAEILGISAWTPRNWVKNLGLKASRFGEKTSPFYIKRRELRRFARERPSLFSGYPESTLIQLLDSERLATEIVEMSLTPRYSKVPVVCIETGKKFSSIRSAALCNYITPETLRKALTRSNRTAAGFHWRKAK